MHSKPGQDYLADFATIGAKPGCSPAELKAAWRRRVSDLHPDRVRPAGVDDDVRSREVLAEINGAYRRLRHFQRRHGRMPGSAPAPGFPGSGEAPWEPDSRPWPRGASRTWWLAVFNTALLVLLALLVWVLLERLGIRDHDGPGGRACAVECLPPSPVSLRLAPQHHLAPLRNSTTSTV